MKKKNIVPFIAFFVGLMTVWATLSNSASYIQNKNLVVQTTITVTAAGTTTLIATSNQVHVATGATTQTYVLPNATLLYNGSFYDFKNLSTGVITIQDSGLNTLFTLKAREAAHVWLTSNAAATGNWKQIIQTQKADILHGELGSLGVDDHSIYHNDVRGDIRYYPRTDYTSIFTGTGTNPVRTVDTTGKISPSLLPSGIGLGTVLGPAAATDNSVAAFDGTDGVTIQGRMVSISDIGNVLPIGGNQYLGNPDNLWHGHFGVTTFGSAPTLKSGILLEDPGAGVNGITLTSPTLSGNYTITLPTAQGSAGTTPRNDGSGNLSWEAADIGPAKYACKYATTTALAASTYANGASGVGATLTEVGVGALSVDGASPSVGDRVLVKDQASTFQNGIYTVTVVGSGILAFVLTRATDYDQATEIQSGSSTFIIGGTANASSTWDMNTTAPATIGTDAITFAQVANGNYVVGPSSSVDNEITLFSGTTGKIVKSATTTGILKGTAGVISAASAGSDYESPLTFSTGLSRAVNTVTLANTAVSAGSYTAANITVDAQGRLTAAANGTVSVNSGDVLSNIGLTTSVTAGAMTINLAGSDLGNPAATNTVTVPFRNVATQNAAFTLRSMTSAVSMTLTNGATLGSRDQFLNHVYVYLIDPTASGVACCELAVSGQPLVDEGRNITTTAIGAGADDPFTIYSTTARTNVPARLIGRIRNLQTIAGNWNAAASENSVMPFVAQPTYASTNSILAVMSGVTTSEFQSECRYDYRNLDMHCRGFWLTLTSGGGTAGITLPQNMLIDRSQMPNWKNITPVGNFKRSGSGTAAEGLRQMFYDGVDTVHIFMNAAPESANTMDKGAGNAFYGAGDYNVFEFNYPAKPIY